MMWNSVAWGFLLRSCGKDGVMTFSVPGGVEMELSVSLVHGNGKWVVNG